MAEIKKTKRSPKEVIESEKEPKLEHAYIKFPGQESIPVTLHAYRRSAIQDEDKVRDLSLKRKDCKYTNIHTHPSSFLDRIFNRNPAVEPSAGDLYHFLSHKNEKTMVIASQNSKSGEIAGYIVIRKPKNYDFFSGELSTFSTNYVFNLFSKPFWKVANIKGLKYRMVPAEGYSVSKSDFSFVKKKGLNNEKLEKFVSAIIGIVGLGVSLYFLPSNITGDIIGRLTLKTSNLIGGIFFIIG